MHTQEAIIREATQKCAQTHDPIEIQKIIEESINKIRSNWEADQEERWMRAEFPEQKLIHSGAS
jgi:hypothetical protein